MKIACNCMEKISNNKNMNKLKLFKSETCYFISICIFCLNLFYNHKNKGLQHELEHLLHCSTTVE